MAALPESYTYGNVVLHLSFVVADTTADPDDNPDAQPAQGTVTFTPSEAMRVVTDEGVYLHEPIVADLDVDGDLSDAEGNKWIRLVTGSYDVSFNVKGSGKRLQPLQVTVTQDHTEADPLDLSAFLSASPPVVLAVRMLTQAEYDAIEDPDPQTAYCIQG